MRATPLLLMLGLSATLAVANPRNPRVVPSAFAATPASGAPPAASGVDGVIDIQPVSESQPDGSSRIASKARDVRADMAKRRGRAAPRQESGFVANMRRKAQAGPLAAGDEAEAGVFLADETKPASERFEVSALLALSKVDRAKPPREQASERLGAMQKLFKASPGEPAAARHLMMAALGAPGEEAIEAAGKVLEAGSAEPEVRADAARLITRRRLLARRIPGLELPDECPGRITLFYAWSKDGPEELAAALSLPEIEGTLRAGLNIDGDVDAAAANAATARLAGPQCYAGKDPLSLAALQMLRPPAWYLLDEAGFVREAGSYERVLRRLELMLAQRQAGQGAAQPGAQSGQPAKPAL